MRIHAPNWSPTTASLPFMREIVREVNGSLANFETLKRFRVVAEEWTQESGELTPSMKLKRRVLTRQYAAVIAELYEDEATARGE